jgi:hypothetical protein
MSKIINKKYIHNTSNININTNIETNKNKSNIDSENNTNISNINNESKTIDIEYFYIKHIDSNKIFALPQSIIQTIGIFGNIFLKDFKKIDYNKKFTKHENLDIGINQNEPLIIVPEIIELQSINKKTFKINLKCNIIFEIIMDWIELWKNNYQESNYYINKPILCTDYFMIFKNKDIDFFDKINEYSNGYWNKYKFTYEKNYFKIDEFKNNFNTYFEKIKPLYKKIKFLCIFIETLNSYYDMPILLDKVITYMCILIKKLSMEEYDLLNKLIKIEQNDIDND